jgi:flagellar biogenesis protein FliO
MDTLLRLMWALPLVVLVGVGLMVAMKRFMAVDSRAPQAPSLLKTLRLSEQTQAHVIDVEGHHFLVVESERSVALEAVANSGAQPPAMKPLRVRTPWQRWANR